MSEPQLSTAPTSEPISLGEARAACRLTDHSLDSQLSDWIDVAVELLQAAAWRQFCTAIYTLNFDAWEDEMILPRPPLASVGSVKYYDTASVQQTLSADVYEVITDQTPGSIRLKYGQTWPPVRGHPDDITITYTCGEAVADVPGRTRQAVRAMVAHIYEHGPGAEIPTGIIALLDRAGVPV